MFLRGLSIKFDRGNGRPFAICVSTHLTTIATVDKSIFESLVETKVNILACRIEQINHISMHPRTSEPNWFVIATFVGISFVFSLIIIAAKS